MSFSVLISIYKDESPVHLQVALESIWQEQSVKPSQIVIVKDGPLTPQLECVLSVWKKNLGSVVKCVAFSKNCGLGEALKAGLEACQYDLVARMDTDDVASPERFERQFEYLKSHPEVDILGSFVQEMTYSGEMVGIRKTPVAHEEVVSCLWASPMIHPSIMMRRSSVLLAGNYDARYRRRQDYELWFRCAEKGLRFYNLPEPLLYYRFGQHTHRKQSPKLALEQAVIGYKGSKRLKMPIVKRLACFIPFIRSLLPTSLQHAMYKVLIPFDPRRRP